METGLQVRFSNSGTLQRKGSLYVSIHYSRVLIQSLRLNHSMSL